jgi:hypothetical protein
MFIPLTIILPSQPVGFRHCLSTLLMILMAFSLRSKVIVWLELSCRPVETTDETAENTLKTGFQ